MDVTDAGGMAASVTTKMATCGTVADGTDADMTAAGGTSACGSAMGGTVVDRTTQT